MALPWVVYEMVTSFLKVGLAFVVAFEIARRLAWAVVHKIGGQHE